MKSTAAARPLAAGMAAVAALVSRTPCSSLTSRLTTVRPKTDS
ncbi:hypothetical protein AAH991_22355 [Microbispora sp. ZYX-F-249]|uniref:Uncharacterized protein n=1 Tax=Microbispora maris TaxID=3144104 RepID=A0ABV0ATI2_9ACTN